MTKAQHKKNPNLFVEKIALFKSSKLSFQDLKNIKFLSTFEMTLRGFEPLRCVTITF